MDHTKTLFCRFEQGALGWAELSHDLRKLKGQLFGGHRASCDRIMLCTPIRTSVFQLALVGARDG
ncbi:MAG: hypothetical protein ACPHL3_06885 [Paracoccaceae bacterium]